jgi:hypothetical protein
MEWSEGVAASSALGIVHLRVAYSQTQAIEITESVKGTVFCLFFRKSCCIRQLLRGQPGCPSTRKTHLIYLKVFKLC